MPDFIDRFGEPCLDSRESLVANRCTSGSGDHELTPHEQSLITA